MPVVAMVDESWRQGIYNRRLGAVGGMKTGQSRLLVALPDRCIEELTGGAPAGKGWFPSGGGGEVSPLLARRHLPSPVKLERGRWGQPCPVHKKGRGKRPEWERIAGARHPCCWPGY